MASQYDVIVVGARNAALSAAIAAKEITDPDLSVDNAPEYFRRRNTYPTSGTTPLPLQGLDGN